MSRGKQKSIPAKSRSLMYVQKTKYLGNQFKDKVDIVNHLNKHFPDAEWAYILHNRDEVDGIPVDDHIHIALYFPNPRSPKSVADIMGDNPQSIEVFTGRWAKQNMFAYLIHATSGAIEDGKYQYDASAVTANFDYIKFMGNVKSTADAKKLDIEDIQARIISGDIILKDFFIDGKLGDASVAGLFYTNNKAKIDRAIETRYRIQMSSREEINLEVIYIQGAAGSGKTTIAKEYAERKYGDYFITGSSNDAVQDYMGESVAIFDDARPSDFDASDWLKMLDPYNNKSTVTSRYYNKYLAVKCIILTTTTPFEDFFVYAKNKAGVDEPVSQFMRRFKVVIQVTPEKDDVGREFAVGQLYAVERITNPDPRSHNRMVGNSIVTYEHELVKLDGMQIRVQTPESKTREAVNDIMKYF